MANIQNGVEYRSRTRTLFLGLGEQRGLPSSSLAERPAPRNTNTRRNQGILAEKPPQHGQIE
jgi:hypothetical protein